MAPVMAPSVRMGQGPASPDADCSQRSMAAATFAPPSPVAWAYTFRVVAELEWPSIADTSGDRHAGRQRRRGRRVPGSVRTALADPEIGRASCREEWRSRWWRGDE